MQSRSASPLGLLILLLFFVGLAALAIWAVPQIERWLNPLENPSSGIGQQLDNLLNPTPTIRPSSATIIHQMQNLSRLETASYTIEKVITAESGQDALAFLFGDRLLFVAHGQVIAGVDLAKMSQGDIIVTDDDRVIVTLPPAEVFVVTLDNDRSYVYDRDTGILGLNQDLETLARQAAEEEILEAALEDGILDLANRNARAYIEQLILAFGFREVIFVAATSTPPPPTLPVTVIVLTPTP